jgi:hypothetical protein
MLMVQGKRNYPLPLQPHPQNQKQNQPKTYIGFGTANGGTSKRWQGQRESAKSAVISVSFVSL